MKRTGSKRGKWVVIAILGIALACAIVGAIFTRHRDHIPSTQPSPLQSFW